MSNTPVSPLNWDEIEAEIAENNRRSSDSVDWDKQRERAKEEFERGVRNGWFDKDGNTIGQDDEESDDE